DPTRDEVSSRLGSLFVHVAGGDPAVAAVLLLATHTLRFLLPVRLAVDAESSERKRLQPPLGDLGLTALADAVAAVVDPPKGVVARLELLAVAVGEDQADLPITGVAGEVVCVHALVLALLAPFVELVLHTAQQLTAHVLESLACFLEERLTHVRPPLEGRG